MSTIPTHICKRRSHWMRFVSLPRFSLRWMLLVLIVLPSALLAAWAGYRTKFSRQRRVIETIMQVVKVRTPEPDGLEDKGLDVAQDWEGRRIRIQSWGGNVRLQFTFVEEQSWARYFYPRGELMNVDNAEIYVSPLVEIPDGFAETVVTQLQKLEMLTSLELDFASLSDRHIAAISTLPRMSRLHVESDQLTDLAIEHICHMRELSEVESSSPMLTDDGVRRLGAQKIELQGLDLTSGRITGEGLAAFHSLWHLSVCVPQISHAGFQDIGKCTALRSLQISRGRITEEDARSLSNLRTVDYLVLQQVNVDEDAWEALFTNGSMQHVQLLWMSPVSRRGLAALQRHPLMSFHWEGTPGWGAKPAVTLPRGSAAELSTISSLRHLWLCNADLGPEDVAALGNATHLVELFLFHTQLTKSQVAWLQSKLPKTTITTD